MQNQFGNTLKAQTGQKEAAISAWREAVRLDPNFAEAYLDLRNSLPQSGSK